MFFLVPEARKGVRIVPYLRKRTAAQVVLDELVPERETREDVAVGTDANHMASGGTSIPSLAEEPQLRRHRKVAEVVHHHDFKMTVEYHCLDVVRLCSQQFLRGGFRPGDVARLQAQLYLIQFQFDYFRLSVAFYNPLMPEIKILKYEISSRPKQVQ